MISDLLDLFLDSDVRQRSDINSHREEIEKLKVQARCIFSKEGLTDLQKENGKLKLYVAVLFRLLVTKGIADRDEILEFVQLIDEEDGACEGTHDGDVLP